MEHRKKFSIAILIITIILDIVCLVALPSTIAVHWDSAGTANGFLPTYQAVLISTAATLLCLLAWALLCNRFQNVPTLKIALGELGSKLVYGIVYSFGLIFSCVGIIINIVFLLLN